MCRSRVLTATVHIWATDILRMILGACGVVTTETLLWVLSSLMLVTFHATPAPAPEAMCCERPTRAPSKADEQYFGPFFAFAVPLESPKREVVPGLDFDYFMRLMNVVSIVYSRKRMTVQVVHIWRLHEVGGATPYRTCMCMDISRVVLPRLRIRLKAINCAVKHPMESPKQVLIQPDARHLPYSPKKQVQNFETAPCQPLRCMQPM